MDAKNFAQNRRERRVVNLFYTVLQYFTYCYNMILENKDTISEKECKEKSNLKLEEYIKEHLVTKYLQNTELKKSFSPAIQELLFEQETAKTYTITGITKRDLIDIIVSNLGLNWEEINNESQYFAFECKRLQGISKNNEYITDIHKFVSREYKFRFPFTGMIGFVEKSKKTIPQIIDDLELKLTKDSEIKSQKIDTKILNKYQIQNFNFSYLSKHEHNTLTKIIEVYHLFFDYSDIIILNNGSE